MLLRASSAPLCLCGSIHSMTTAAVTVNDIIRRDRRFGWLMTAPGLAALMLVVTWPVLLSIGISACDYSLLNPGCNGFVGIDNYRNAFEQDYFGESILVTLKFVVAVVVIE